MVHAFGNTSLLRWYFCFSDCSVTSCFVLFSLLNSPLPSLISLNADSLQVILSYLSQLSTSTLIFMLDVSQIISPYFCSVFKSRICTCQLTIFTWVFYTKPTCQKLSIDASLSAFFCSVLYHSLSHIDSKLKQSLWLLPFCTHHSFNFPCWNCLERLSAL